LGHLLKPICQTAHALFQGSARCGRSHGRSGIMTQAAKPDARFEITVPSQASENL
jgi:hypothetical protein